MNDIDDETQSCELADEELVAEERDNTQTLTHHNLMIIKRNGFLPLKFAKESPALKESNDIKIALNEDSEDDIIQLSKTQHARKLPLTSSIVLFEKKLFNP